MPIIDIIIDFCNTPGAKLGTKIGTKYVLILMLIFHSSSLIILLKAQSFYLLLLSLSLLGIGSGISSLTYLRNAWKYFPNNQGLIYGIILSSSGIFSTLLVVLADFVVINPNKENTINGIYPKYVADNVYKYNQIIVIVLGSIDIIGFLLIYDYDKLPETQEDKINKSKKKYANIDINTPNPDNQIKSINNDYIKLKAAFFSKINFKLFLFCFCGFCKYYIFFYISILSL